MEDFTCRHCGRPIRVPASTCPWCGEPIMVICANCKAYTDDQKSHCQHCGASLVPDKMEEIKKVARRSEVTDLAQDRERAQLVASAVVVNNLRDFFYVDDQGRKTLLVDLFGTLNETTSAPAGLLFAAYAYLVQKGYCSPQVEVDSSGVSQIKLDQLRFWDGQAKCIEARLMDEMVLASELREVTDQAVRKLMGFQVTMARSPSSGLLGLPIGSQRRPHDASDRSAFAALDQLARLTMLPEHSVDEACRDTYRLLRGFVTAQRELANVLAQEIIEVVSWFERYEQDPTLGVGME